MLNRTQIKQLAYYTDSYKKGIDLFEKGRVLIKSVDFDEKNLRQVEATVVESSSKSFDISLTLSDNDNYIEDACCSCNSYENRYGCCMHILAVLIALKDKFDSVPAYNNEPLVRQLIYKYTERTVSKVEFDPRKAQISAFLELYNDVIRMYIKIGYDRLYSVKNIKNFADAVENGKTIEYGKAFKFSHKLINFAEEDRPFVKYLVNLSKDNTSLKYQMYYSDKKFFTVYGQKVDDFFKCYKNTEISLNDEIYKISYENPSVKINIKASLKDDYSVELSEENDNLILIGTGECAYFADEAKHIIYCTDKSYTECTIDLFEVLIGSGKKIIISKKEMPLFYSAVIIPVKQYADICSNADLSLIEPPQMEAKLYLDSPQQDTVYARLEFSYGDKLFPSFYDKTMNPYCDLQNELISERIVQKYFSIDRDSDHHQLYIMEDNDALYCLLKDGIKELSKYMELYATDRFNSMNLRPPVKVNIGVKLNSNLLELDVNTGDFSIQELLDALNSYKKGRKYHRLRDGSFVDLDQNSLQEFAKITEELNLTDKALLKEKIKIPAYRMLYLDSLQQHNTGVTFDRSKEFKRAIRDYKNKSEGEFSVPECLDGILREYQKEGYYWLKTISAYGFGGILADDMGLGKTLQAIALLVAYKNETQNHEPSLVICPSSLTLNWESEVKKFAPALTTVTVIGTAAEREALLKQSDSADIVITSYSLLTRDIADYADKKFYCQFIDEAQFIKNHNTQTAKSVKAIKSKIRFALTGTPVENSLAELWSIYDYIMPDYLFNYNHFKKTYESPIVKDNSEKAVQSLKRLSTPFILRRMKKDVLTELPDKTESVIFAEMEEEQNKLYAANVIEMKQTLASQAENCFENEGRFAVLAMLTKLRQICCDPSLVYENYSGGSSKLEACMELIESCINSGHKLLLFSQFTSMLSIIENKLTENSISYFKLTGSTKADERLRLVNRFNEDTTSVFLISLKAGGTGLNLTGADIVIHYDPWWNLSAENQATDRAYRIGQENSVQVYKLIAKGTIEEKIQQLQASKAELADIVIKDSDGGIMRMSADDIMKIFE